MARVAILLLTPRCNMECRFCGAEAGFDVMTFKQACELIEGLADKGTESVVFGGGEPFLWNEGLYLLARFARVRGLTVQVGTNGTLAPENDEALSEFDRWILPLESLDAGVHDALRPHAGGHLSRIVRLLERLRRSGVDATISSLVTRKNFDQLLEIGNFLDWYRCNGGKLHAWHLYQFLPVGRGGAVYAPDFATQAGIFESLGRLLKTHFHGMRIYLRPDMYHSREVSFHWFEKGSHKSLQPTPPTRLDPGQVLAA